MVLKVKKDVHGEIVELLTRIKGNLFYGKLVSCFNANFKHNSNYLTRVHRCPTSLKSKEIFFFTKYISESSHNKRKITKI